MEKLQCVYNQISENDLNPTPDTEKPLGLVLEKGYIVYKVQYTNFKQTYIGETGRNIQKRLREHRAPVKRGNWRNGQSPHKGLESRRWSYQPWLWPLDEIHYYGCHSFRHFYLSIALTMLIATLFMSASSCVSSWLPFLQIRIAGRFRGRKRELVKDTIFVEKTFADCLLCHAKGCHTPNFAEKTFETSYFVWFFGTVRLMNLDFNIMQWGSTTKVTFHINFKEVSDLEWSILVVDTPQ